MCITEILLPIGLTSDYFVFCFLKKILQATIFLGITEECSFKILNGITIDCLMYTTLSTPEAKTIVLVMAIDNRWFQEIVDHCCDVH